MFGADQGAAAASSSSGNNPTTNLNLNLNLNNIAVRRAYYKADKLLQQNQVNALKREREMEMEDARKQEESQPKKRRKRTSTSSMKLKKHRNSASGQPQEIRGFGGQVIDKTCGTPPGFYRPEPGMTPIPINGGKN